MATTMLQQIINGVKDGLVISVIIGLVIIFGDFVAETLLHCDILSGI